MTGTFLVTFRPMTLVWILISVLLIGLISMIGIIFFAQGLDMKKATSYLISLASGTMLGTALLHLIPESLEINADRALIVISVGVFVFFILEKFLIWRHCHLHQYPDDHTRPTAANMV